MKKYVTVNQSPFQDSGRVIRIRRFHVFYISSMHSSSELFLDVYQKKEAKPPHTRTYLSICEKRQSEKGKFKRIHFSLCTREAIKKLRNSFNDVLAFFDSQKITDDFI